MTPINGANSGIVNRLVSKATRPNPPAPTPATAIPIGRPIASTDPNARISTTTANARPISSDSGGWNSANTDPPISVRRPSIFGSSSSIVTPIAADSVSLMSLARLIWAKAIVPSSLICSAPNGVYGLMTSTPGISPTVWNTTDIGSAISGVVTPSADWNTIWPPNTLLAPGKYSVRVSNPLALSEAGVSNSPLYDEPTTPPIALRPTIRAIQIPTTIHRWW